MVWYSSGIKPPTEPHWSKTLGGRKIVKSTSAKAYNIKMNPYRAPYCISIAPKSARLNETYVYLLLHLEPNNNV